MKKIAFKIGVLLLISCSLLLAQSNDNSFIYLKPLENTQKEFRELNNIVSFRILIDGQLVIASSNIEDLQNHLAVDSYKSWISKDKREVTIIYTLSDMTELVYKTTKQTSTLLSQSVYFFN